jgi:hypothetical protein
MVEDIDPKAFIYQHNKRAPEATVHRIIKKITPSQSQAVIKVFTLPCF